ncbi:TPA: hypothetical protein MYV55_004692 [Klebsiella aerogenes]|uniref:hypothetical protein n=1 Tax=Klebsiella aerogenes TaxID=548 RepID=UPI00388FEB0D|nr:hypothetical protein [Klebsiella aerogenes]HCM1710057.1 hypothetical protein [Klebsiella aerogenes]
MYPAIGKPGKQRRHRLPVNHSKHFATAPLGCQACKATPATGGSSGEKRRVVQLWTTRCCSVARSGNIRRHCACSGTFAGGETLTAASENARHIAAANTAPQSNVNDHPRSASRRSIATRIGGFSCKEKAE